MKVKPFVFLIELWQDPRLGGYLTCLDIAVAVVYGRTHKCHDICVEKILKVRETGDLATVIESVDDVRTPKRYHEHNPEEDLARGIQDAKDIANTAKNYLESAQLIVTDAEDNKRFELNEDVCVQGDTPSICRPSSTIKRPLTARRPPRSGFSSVACGTA